MAPATLGGRPRSLTRQRTRRAAGAGRVAPAAARHTCGPRTDGEITCWGDGAASYSLTYDAPPVDSPAAPPPGPFTAVAAGFWHTCALRPDGTATCWLSY